MEHSVRTEAFGLREVRGIYRSEGIRIDLRPLSNGLKAIYLCEDGEVSVAIRRSLPDEPRLFAQVHELKHHWADQALIMAGVLKCGEYNENEVFEIGAEVFAAEFIYPEDEFAEDVAMSGTVEWTPEAVVRFRREFCRAKVSYTFLVKRLEWLEFVPRGTLARVRFQKLEDEVYGLPIYKQPGFQERRRAKLRRRAQ